MQSFLGLLIATGGFANAVEQPTLPKGMPAIPPTYLPPSYRIGAEAVGYQPAVITAPNPPVVSADVTTNASHASVNSTPPLPAGGFEHAADNIHLATLPAGMTVVKKPGQKPYINFMKKMPGQHATAHLPVGNGLHRPTHSPTAGDKFEAETGILKNDHAELNSVGPMFDHLEEGEISPFNLSKTITSIFHHPRTTFCVFGVLLVMIVAAGAYGMRKLLKERPDLLEDTPGDVESGRPAPARLQIEDQIQQVEARWHNLESRWQHVETSWERSTNFLSFLRILTHGQARDMSVGLMRSADGEIEMAPQEHSYQAVQIQAPQEQEEPKEEQPKPAPEWHPSVQEFAEATDEYQQMLTPR